MAKSRKVDSEKMPKPDADGYYRKTFYFEGKQKSARGITWEEAVAKAALKLQAFEKGEIGISRKMTVLKWSENWMPTYRKGKISGATYKADQSRLDNIILPVIGAMEIQRVKNIHIQKIYNAIEESSQSKINKVVTLLWNMFEDAKEDDLITKNPVNRKKAPDGSEGSHRAITDEERKYILKTAEYHKAGLWIKILLFCGPRPGETIALFGHSIDFEKKLLQIRQANEADTNELKDPKSEAGIRNVPIPDNFIGDLKAANCGPDEPLFKQETTGKRHTKTSLRKLWESFKKALDIEMGAKTDKWGSIVLSVVADDLTPYCLRHTFCTDLELAGIDINIAKYLMGHSDIRTTSKIYTHQGAKTAELARDKINKYNNKHNIIQSGEKKGKTFKLIRRAV